MQIYSIIINFKAVFCKKYVFLHDNNLKTHKTAVNE